MDFAVGSQGFISRLMVDLAVYRDSALLELLAQRREARRKRRQQFGHARRVDRDLLDPAGVLGPAARKVNRCHVRSDPPEPVRLTDAATGHDIQRRNLRTRRTKQVFSAGSASSALLVVPSFPPTLPRVRRWPDVRRGRAAHAAATAAAP